MKRRHAQVFDVEEVTELSDDEPIEASAPTVVTSAAPLQVCVTTTGPTRREVPVARPPGTPLGAPRPPRRARLWLTVPPVLETAPVGRIPLPGERPSAEVVTIVQRPAREKPMAVQRTRAAEPHAAYSVEREVSALATPRRAGPRPSHAAARQGYVLVGIIALFAGFVTMLSVVVVRQQAELRQIREPAQRAAQACATYADEVRSIAGELTQAAGEVADVERRIGERARTVMNERALQRLCAADADAQRWTCPGGDPACLAAAVMQLRQALAHTAR